MSFNYENRRRADEIVTWYPSARSALLPLLHLAQDQDGWLTTQAMREVAEILGLTPSEVLGTASFYTMFKREDVGRHIVSVCTNISCLLLGGFELLEHLEEGLGVRRGQSTPDGEVYLEEAECLAACGGAPCLQVDYEYFENVTGAESDEIVTALKRGERPSGGRGLPSDFYGDLRALRATEARGGGDG